MENYRPISLLIKLSKLLEKCMYTWLYNFLNKNNILYDKQYGFRSKHSCEQAIQDLCGHVLKNRQDGQKMIAVYLDLWKAFDTLSHNLLLKKSEIYGLRGLCNQWLESYITNRSLQVKCRTISCNTEEMSNKYQITYGTAQGSCLGPLLFDKFCNDIYLNVEYCKIILFADDTTLYTSHRNTWYLMFEIQHDLENLNK